MTTEQMELLKILLSSIGGGVLVAIINWLTSRGNNKANEIKKLQETWHSEFDRLDNEVKELRADIQGRDATIEEITSKYQQLKTDYEGLQTLLRKRDKKICDQDELIRKLSQRIEELENLMRKYEIDPDCGG